MAANGAQRREHYDTMERMREREETDVSKQFEDAIGEQVRGAASAISRGADPFSVKSSVEDVYRQVWLGLVPVFAGPVFERIMATKGHGDDEIAEWAAATEDYLDGTGAKRVGLIDDTTDVFIRGVIQDGIEEGLGAQATAKALRDKWEDISKVRADRIARTEVVGASNFASNQAAISTGLDLLKQWLTTPDNRVRDSHRSMNGATTDMEGTFSNGLFTPAVDLTGNVSASEIVNCRCTVVYVET